MKKKFLLSLGVVMSMMVGVVSVSAFEAHVINVTAQIENALSVSPKTITFGTVFPQEVLHHDLSVNLSPAFLETDRVDNVKYRIAQKLHPVEQGYDGVVENIDDVQDAEGTYYPSLCAYLSKHKVETDFYQNEVEVDSFHNSRHWAPSEHVMYDAIASGYLTKLGNDTEDTWDIDLAVPCFEGECAQDWTTWVAGINGSVNPNDYVLPQELKDATFMCDLWVEVTAIEERPDCKMKVDFSLIENSGDGDFENKVFVGPSEEEYSEGAWIDLDVVDGGIAADVPGLAIERMADKIKVSVVGSHKGETAGGKEVVNGLITIDGGYFTGISNVDYEKWGDNTYINGNAGQDEAFYDMDSSNFYSTVTTADDTYYIDYTCGIPVVE